MTEYKINDYEYSQFSVRDSGILAEIELKNDDKIRGMIKLDTYLISR